MVLGAAGCGARKPPFSPGEALKTFRLPPGFRMELVAAEPEVSDPVAMTFDESGRLYVVEMPDYPLDPQPKGRVKLLEDPDGDGRYRRSTVFAEGLHMPTGVMRWGRGILVSSPPDILYFEDTNGDNRADIRRVVLTGFAATNPQLRANGLLYGMDNWIYAAYPRVLTPRRYAKEFGDPGQAIRFPDHPEIEPVETRSQDLRFHPDPPRVEAVSGNSQFANTFDAWGNRFTVWNNDHVRHVVIQRQYLARNPYLAVPVAMESVSDHENSATVYAVTRDPLHIHDTQIGHFTSACGLSVYTGGGFPAEFDGNSFTCEPVHNLVHRDILVPRGATFVAKRAHEGSEFLASTDAWFRPVFTTTGPDGALYVVDYYRFTVEHPEFVPPEMLKRIDFQAHERLGRIWRVVHETTKASERPRLDQATPAELVERLSHPNQWWRTNAQRLLVDRRDRGVAAALENLARSGASPLGRLHALWTLEGLGALSSELVLGALSDAHAGVREHAVRLAEPLLSDPRVRQKVFALADDPEPRVEFQVACALAQLPPEQSFDTLHRIALRHLDDPWFRVAVLTGAADNAEVWFRAVLKEARPGAGEDFLRRIASIIGSRSVEREFAGVVAAVAAAPAAGWRAAALEGLADGVRQGSRRVTAGQAELIQILGRESRGPVAKAALSLARAAALTPSPQLLGRVAAVAQSAQAGAEERAQAIGILGLDPNGAAALGQFLTPQQPEALQIAAAEALATMRTGDVAPLLIDRWRVSAGPVRKILLDAFFRERSRLPALLDAIEAEKIQPWALDQARTRQLLHHSDPEIRERARKLLADAGGKDRQAVYERYLAVLQMTGHADRGKPVFDRVCAECHKIGASGHAVGPDLLSVTAKYKEVLLADILMPNQAIEAGYEEYMVETRDGRQITGVLARETPTSLTLRRAKGEEDTVLRSSVRTVRSLAVSPMPDDLEKSITVEQMADLIAYVKSLK